MTIRTRLTFLYASLLAIAMLLFSLATLSVLKWTLRSQVDQTLLKAADSIRRDWLVDVTSSGGQNPYLSQVSRTQFNSVSAPGLYTQVWIYDPDAVWPTLDFSSWSLLGIDYHDPLDPRALGFASEARRDVSIDGHHMRVITKPLTLSGEVRGYVQIAQSLRTVDAAMDRLLKIMIVGGAIALIAALLLGDYLTKRALQPVDTIAQTAQQIAAADDLSRRIPYNGPPDELGQLTRTFNDTLERLEKLFNVQRRFVADVSHEMRTPLTTIRGNVDLIRRFGYDEEAVAAIDGEARRMSRLVEDLLLLAKADAGRLPLENAVVELDTLVLEVYNQARLFGEGVHVKLGAMDQLQVEGDADRLKQLLLNLVSNGIKYTPEGGSVTLSVTRDERWARIDVSDTGIGIPSEDLPHIFDRFYRVDKARSRAKGGTGLGLSIAQWIAEAHGGTLRVTSALGQGSTFSVLIPALVADDAPASSRRDALPALRPMRLPRSLRNTH